MSAPRDIRAPKSELETCANCECARLHHRLVVVKERGQVGITTVRGPCTRCWFGCIRFVPRRFP